ncbi:MAG: DUF3237 domain-containing protein [Erysipelotrichaceae bacterium]|nr:DUF3237 domain-containing protein [Erysipelotrichaceae bacterium]
MDNKAFLEIHIDIAESGLKMETPIGEVSMIPFAGTVDCELFKGIVEPWGVDTQIVDTSNIRHLSARYVLTGKDKEGNDCHIYIENNGWMENKPSMQFKTVPTFMTDSPLLAAFLHRNCFYGTGTVEKDGLWIRFYELV